MAHVPEAQAVCYTGYNGMKIQKFRKFAVLSAVAVFLIVGGAGQAYAETSQSEHYRVNEVQFGVGGGRGLCSGSYCSDISVGDTTVGSANSDSYGARFGFNTSTEPYLEVWSEGANANLGILSPSTTATATNMLKVRNYLSSGYVVQITGETPSQGTHALDRITTPSTSQPGAEQFGINLADNTSPDIGAAPVQVPDNTISFGYAHADYGTPDLFKYENGGIVAQSDTSTGQTEYTISMIINVSNVTPGGKYTGSFSAVVVPVF